MESTLIWTVTYLNSIYLPNYVTKVYITGSIILYGEVNVFSKTRTYV